MEAFDAAYASIPFEQNTLIPEELGCKLTEQGYIEVDEMGKLLRTEFLLVGIAVR